MFIRADFKFPYTVIGAFNRFAYYCRFCFLGYVVNTIVIGCNKFNIGMLNCRIIYIFIKTYIVYGLGSIAKEPESILAYRYIANFVYIICIFTFEQFAGFQVIFFENILLYYFEAVTVFICFILKNTLRSIEIAI